MDFDSFRIDNKALRINLSHRALAAEEVSALLEYLRINPEITSLSLIKTRITSDSIKIIANSEQLKNLTSLDLSNNQIGAAGAKDIANSEQLKNLTSLDLSYNKIGAAGAKDIANSEQLKNLNSLVLSDNKIGAAGAKDIANSEQLKNLTSLDLSYNQIGDAGAKDIANSEQLKNLTSLVLSYNQIGGAGAKDIANSEQLKNLNSLVLSDNKIGDAGAKDIANSEQLKNLNSLDLSNNQIGAAGAKDIANSEQLKNLNSLVLSDNKIGAAGAKDIANSEQLKNLTSLDLSYNQIGDAGAKDIANSEQLKNLTSLVLSYNQIGGAGVEELFKSSINVSVRFDEYSLALFYSTLVKINDAQARDKNANIEPYVKDMMFDIAPYITDTPDAQKILRHILEHPDKYPFLINSVDGGGHRLDHFYTNHPEMQKFLFEHGLVPKEEQPDEAMQDIARDNQSVHDKNIVNKTNFITNELVTRLVTDSNDIRLGKNDLPQKAENYTSAILPNLFSNDRKQLNPLAIKLLDLAEADKRSVMEKVIGNNPLPSDEEFVELVRTQAIQILRDAYLEGATISKYNGYSTNPMQYDWTKGAEKKITIPESIGLIASLIEKTSIPRKDKQELCVTLFSKNPELVEQNLKAIKSVLKQDNISLQELQNPSILHQLLNDLSENQIDKLFKDVSSLDIKDTWRDQQRFKLAKQLYVAATAYGDNSTACIQGAWSQIITTAEEVDSKLLDQYAEHVEKLKKEEALKSNISEMNIAPLIEQMLTKFVEDNNIINNAQEQREALSDLLVNMIDVSNPANITLDQQQVLAQVNKGFTQHIKEHVPNYNRNIPTFADYKKFIEEIANSPQAGQLLQILEAPTTQTLPEIPQEITEALAGIKRGGDDQQPGPSRPRPRSQSPQPGPSR